MENLKDQKVYKESCNNMVDKKDLLFELRNIVGYISYEDLKEILNNFVSHSYIKNTVMHFVLQIKLKDNNHINIVFTNNEFWRIEWINTSSCAYNSVHYHRINKPAIIYSNGNKSWYEYGKLIKTYDAGKLTVWRK